MITAAMLDAMLAGGSSAAQIVEVVKADLADREARDARKRELASAKQARWRAGRRLQKDVDGSRRLHASTPGEHIETAEEFRLSVENDETGASLSYLLTSTEDSLKERKKERVRARVAKGGPIPDGWKPTAEHFAVAAKFHVDLVDCEERFRDYCASSGKQYANHDAAFRNFIKNQPNFNGKGNGNGRAKDARTRILEEVFGRNDGGRGQALDGDHAGLLPGFEGR